jgi:excisionase family DNA binding protein
MLQGHAGLVPRVAYFFALTPKKVASHRSLNMKSTAPPTKRLLIPPREAATLLSVSPRTLHTLTKSGEIPSVVLGTRGRRYSVESLQKIIDKQLNGAKS